MTTESKNRMREIMSLAWQFVKRNGFDLSQALKTAWANVKLHAALKKGIVKFYFTKVDGSLREAYGTERKLVARNQGHRQKAVRHGASVLRHRETRVSLLQESEPCEDGIITND